MKVLATSIFAAGIMFCFAWCTVESKRMELEKYKIEIESQQLK